MDHTLADYLKAGAAEYGAELDECMVRRFLNIRGSCWNGTGK